MTGTTGAKKRGSASAFVTRLLLAHGLSLPLTLLWAAASMPPIIHLRIAELERLPDMQAIGTAIVRLAAWPAGAVFLLAHLVVLPWALERRRGRTIFFVALGILAGVGLLGGAAGWIALHLHVRALDAGG